MTAAFTDGTDVVTLALGVGKRAKKRFALADYNQVVQALQQFPKDIALKYQKKALVKAAKPGVAALQSNVLALGRVTGNLLASVTQETRTYTNNRAGIPVAVAVIGFRRPVNQNSQKGAEPAFEGGSVLYGPNRAYHSHLIEKGTKPRRPGYKTRSRRKGRIILGGRIRSRIENVTEESGNRSGILSSFKGRGPFKAPGRGKYPKDFIATGQVRGNRAYRPLERAFRSSRSSMQSILDVELRKALTNAAKEYQRRFNDLG